MIKKPETESSMIPSDKADKEPALSGEDLWRCVCLWVARGWLTTPVVPSKSV